MFIVKAQSVAQAGTINLRFSAFSGRRVEICGNMIDDDTNGLTDCDDPGLLRRGGLPGARLHAGSRTSGTSRGERGARVTVDTRDGVHVLPDVVQPRHGQGEACCAST